MKTTHKVIFFSGIIFFTTLLNAAPKQTVSVLYFENTAKNSSYAWLSKGLADMLITDLSQVPSIAVVEREELQKVLKEHALGMTGLGDTRKALKTGKFLQAKKIITGSFIERRGSLRIDCKVINAETGKVSSVKISGKSSDVLRLQENLLQQVQSVFGLTKKVKPLRDTKSREAMRYYYRGLDSLDRGKYKSAERNFKKSIDYDPAYSLPQRDLEKAYRFLMNFQKARIQRELSILFDAVRIVRGRLNSASLIWLDRKIKKLEKKSRNRSGFISWPFLKGRVSSSEEVDSIDSLSYLLEKVNSKQAELDAAFNSSDMAAPGFRKEEKKLTAAYRKKNSEINIRLRKFRQTRSHDPEEGRSISRDRNELIRWYRKEQKKLKAARKNYQENKSAVLDHSSQKSIKRKMKYAAEVLHYWNRAWKNYHDTKNRESLVAIRLYLHYGNRQWKETVEWSKYYMMNFPDGRRTRVAEAYYKTSLDRIKNKR